MQKFFSQSTVFETFLLLSSQKIAYCFLSFLRQDVPKDPVDRLEAITPSAAFTLDRAPPALQGAISIL